MAAAPCCSVQIENNFLIFFFFNQQFLFIRLFLFGHVKQFTPVPDMIEENVVLLLKPVLRCKWKKRLPSLSSLQPQRFIFVLAVALLLSTASLETCGGQKVSKSDCQQILDI